MTAHAILTPEAHRALRIRSERGAAMGDAVMSCVTLPIEFRQVQNEYPILFRMNAERTGFTALAMFGFETGENLFLDGERWDARHRPLAIDIQPFLIGRTADGSGPGQVHVDLASPRISDAEGVRVFDDYGRLTPYLDDIAEKLGLLEAGLAEVDAFFAALNRHALLEPLTLDITLDSGAQHNLVGFHAIDEDRLRALGADALGDLHQGGHLMPIFMAVASLANWGALIARKNARG